MTLIIKTFIKYEKHPTILHCPLALTVVAVVVVVVAVVVCDAGEGGRRSVGPIM